MAGRTGTAAKVTGVVLAVASALTVVLVVRSEVVQGPLPLNPAGSALVATAAVVLVLAAIAASLVLADADVGWHVDGPLCTAALVALCGSVLVGWAQAPDVLRSAGSLVEPMMAPTLLALVERRARRTLGWSAIAAVCVGVLSLVRYAVRDPFHDLDCWTDCSLRGVAPLESAQAAAVVAPLLDVAVAAVAGLAAALTIRLAVRRGRDAPVDLAIAGAAAAASVAWAATALVTERSAAARVVGVALLALCAGALLVTTQPALALLRRRELRRLAVALGDQPPPGTLEATLGQLLGSKDVRVEYWLPESRRYVDVSGEPVDSDPRGAVTLSRDGQPLARVFLETPDRGSSGLEGLVGSAALLAIDSERLQAEVRAQLVELLAARRRIVAAADGARQQVERTIHDDVQAELMGALLQLGQVRSSAEEAGEDARAREAAGIAEEVRTLVSHLRDFSRGVYPAVLDASGLGAALDALADEAPVALRIHCGVDGGASVEALRATYLLVLDAATRATGDLDVRVDALEGLLGLAIVGHPGGVREDLSDRVGALGGTISVDAGTLRVVLPCA